MPPAVCESLTTADISQQEQRERGGQLIPLGEGELHRRLTPVRYRHRGQTGGVALVGRRQTGARTQSEREQLARDEEEDRLADHELLGGHVAPHVLGFVERDAVDRGEPGGEWHAARGDVLLHGRHVVSWWTKHRVRRRSGYTYSTG